HLPTLTENPQDISERIYPCIFAAVFHAAVRSLSWPAIFAPTSVAQPAIYYIRRLPQLSICLQYTYPPFHKQTLVFPQKRRMSMKGESSGPCSVHQHRFD